MAAHSETVLVSGWNDSYGNQVLLDNGSGFHAVRPYDANYRYRRGSGNGRAGYWVCRQHRRHHLHFEVMQNGVRVNPMDMVSVR